MKRFILITFAIVGYCSMNAQTIKGDFEVWENRLYFFGAPPFIPLELVNYFDPDGWTSLNQFTRSIFFGNKLNAEQSNDSYIGMSSVKLVSDTVSVPGFGSFTIPGVLINGEFELDLLSLITGGGTIDPLSIADIGQPYTLKPSKFVGYFRYNPTGADSCIMSAVLMSEGIPIGEGTFISGMDTDTNFVYFEANINYFGCGTPDTVIIAMSSSSIGLGSTGGIGSTLYVDSIDLYVPPGGFNTAPIARDDSASTTGNNPVIVDVLQNDEDCENDMLQVVAITTQASSGTTNINTDNSISYVADLGFYGIDEFTYAICDPSFLCDTATVYVVVDSLSWIEEIQLHDEYEIVYDQGSHVIDFVANSGKYFGFKLCDINGKYLKSALPSVEHKIDLTGLPSGIYILGIYDAANMKTTVHRVLKVN